jgi:hypothetical protein
MCLSLLSYQVGNLGLRCQDIVFIVDESLFYQWDYEFLQTFFSLSKIHIYTKTPSTFKFPKSRSSTKSRAHYIKNEWPNLNEDTIAMEENEWEADDVKEFMNYFLHSL